MSTTELDITPELAMMAARTLKEFCKSNNNNCNKNNVTCPFLQEDMVCAFTKLRVPCELQV